MSDSISRQAAIRWVKTECNPYGKPTLDFESGKKVIEHLEQMPFADRPQEWIPCSERLPEHSYTRRFWLTVKLDDDEGTVTTLIGTWGAWGGGKGSKPYDAFDCWKDVMINGGIYRLSQPIPKEQVLAWMPLPEPWKGADDEA